MGWTNASLLQEKRETSGTFSYDSVTVDADSVHFTELCVTGSDTFNMSLPLAVFTILQADEVLSTFVDAPEFRAIYTISHATYVLRGGNRGTETFNFCTTGTQTYSLHEHSLDALGSYAVQTMSLLSDFECTANLTFNRSGPGLNPSLQTVSASTYDRATLTQSGDDGTYQFDMTLTTEHDKKNHPLNIIPYVLPLVRVEIPIPVQSVPMGNMAHTELISEGPGTPGVQFEYFLSNVPFDLRGYMAETDPRRVPLSCKWIE